MYLLIVMLVALAAFAAVVFYPRRVSAHCDTMDGPTVKDGKLALERNDLNYALKWVAADDTEELRKIFAQSIKVRALGPDAEDLADRFFLESLVRIVSAIFSSCIRMRLIMLVSIMKVVDTSAMLPSDHGAA